MAKRIDDNRLLPCPFCGEPAAIWYFPQHDRPLLKEAYYVGCTNDNCGCELDHPGAFKSLDDAVSAWNRRPLEQEPILDKIRAEIETKYGQCDICEYDSDYCGWNQVGDIADILQIIDKYKAESEVEDGNDD